MIWSKHPIYQFILKNDNSLNKNTDIEQKENGNAYRSRTSTKSRIGKKPKMVKIDTSNMIKIRHQ